ncbi:MULTISPECIES: peptidoglycan D,D-transpeptidase FtsI family protein [unclassified Pseudoclavibacter]|uniref:peptidoglycan D,D-transpeptidase FtsI family protein n=1 Tax=unclassified Pseudoclavibacter TaxID=2615177 RepID=UPI000CE8A044|nr:MULTISPECIES: penicillin-binding protein 2 [unclassified Pseudoclavibacter]MBS3178112.1 penicillin-binding protein 2 [Pseudoclavibacter sp. Marseille-Q4354]PPG29236.1 penicillin-binding protein 2 [Pseudoclavibacter sp. RFBB5]
MSPKVSRRRAGLVIILVTAVLIAFGVRLIDVQLVSASTINADAESKRGVSSTIFSERGSIVDKNGEILADSADRFDLTVAPVNVKEFDRTGDDGKTSEVSREQALGEIAAITGQQQAELVGVVDAALAIDPNSNFAYLSRGLELAAYEKIRALEIPWIYPKREAARVYPNGQVAGNLTGFLGADGEPLAGLELSENQCLAGIDGEETYERSADNVRIPGTEVTLTEAKQGGTLKLTVDADLQWYALQVLAEQVTAMGGKWGHATVMEIETGKVLAVADYPSVDPNDPGATATEARGSRAFTAPYEPGSTMKALTAAMVFDKGLSTPGEQITVPGRFEQTDVSFGDDWAHGDERWTAAGIMTRSSNIGIAMMGERLSASERYDYMLDFGLNADTEADFLGEESGTVHPWEDWDPQTNYATMFGQGLQVTAPQMASAYATIANGGQRLPVQLVEGCETEDGFQETEPGEPRQVVSAQAAADTLTLLEATAQSGSLAKQVAIPGYRVGIKTGTAEVSAGDGTYLQGQYMASMAGVAPIDDPKYVVTVSIMNPTTMTGSAATAPAWHDVMAYVLQSNRVAPSPSPWPTIPTTF